MAQEKYDAFLKAQNFKLALQSLKRAAKALGKAGEPALERKATALGREVIGIAYKVVPKEQWDTIRE